VLPHHTAVIFDEAHLLETVATQFFGISISSHRVEDFVRDAERELRYTSEKDTDCLDHCKRLLRYASRFFNYFRKEGDRYRLRKHDFTAEALEAGSELLQSFKRFDRLISRRELKSDGVKHLSERIELLVNDLLCFLEEKKEEGELIYWAEHRRQTVFLHATPLNVADILRERLFDGEISVILTSATLSAQGRFDFIKEGLGIQETEEVVFDTSFQYDKQALFYLPSHLPNPSSPRFPDAVSEEVVRVLRESKGRAFLLFTSWRNLEVVYQNVSRQLPYRLLKQGEQPKQALIRTFRKDIHSVLFGTTSFWQGVDVEGEALSCVIIDKLPFASPTDPLTSARIEALAQKGEEPFISFQIPVAILSLRQGVGRLIRNSQDRGLVAILDHRIKKKGYGRHFLSSLPDAPRTSDFKDVVTFFKKC